MKPLEFILAIDGRCASGKTTLANKLALEYHANVFHMDDFYLPFNQREEQVGEHMDYQRLIDSVLIPLNLKQDVHYQSYNPHDDTYSDLGIIEYRPCNIIEGSYSLYPLLTQYYTYCIVLDIDSHLQKERLKQRKNYDAYLSTWIPKEEAYFSYYSIYEKYPIYNMKEGEENENRG